MTLRALTALVVLALATCARAAAQERGVVVADLRLPPAGAVYRGGTHTFPGGARLTCGSHGGFTSGFPPPARPGTTVIADYRATFTGELMLSSTSTAATVVHPISAPIRMVERITFGGRRGDAQVLETEIVALDLAGGGLPDGVLVRESPGLGSLGRTTISAHGRGQSRIESVYDVWLELSTDGGRSWRPADSAVRMELAPAPAARIAPGGEQPDG